MRRLNSCSCLQISLALTGSCTASYTEVMATVWIYRRGAKGPAQQMSGVPITHLWNHLSTTHKMRSGVFEVQGTAFPTAEVGILWDTNLDVGRGPNRLNVDLRLGDRVILDPADFAQAQVKQRRAAQAAASSRSPAPHEM